MHKNSNKIGLLAAIFLSTTTHALHATIDSAQMRNLENRVNSLEQRRGATGVINPPGRPQVRDGVDLFLFGDLLCWNAHENGLAFAIVNRSSPTNLSHSTVRSVHSDWNVGFRAGIGYNLPHDGWDVNFTWLRFYTHGNKHIPSHNNVFIFPTRAAPGDLLAGDSPSSKAKTHWGLRLNQLDLDLGREFFVSKWLTLRPHFGLRTDWIRQTWNSKFRNFSNTPLPNKLQLKYKDEWWGLGLEGGLDTQWGLGSGFSLFGNICGAILYGFHDIDFKDKDIPRQRNTNHKGEFADLDNVYRISHPILDLMMGLRYDYMFYNDRFHLGFQLGWEHHIYFSQNQFPVFVDDAAVGTFVSNQGDLTFQGWAFAARFDF
jgi:Legionella pneumophila major outer membrane protein precursor